MASIHKTPQGTYRVKYRDRTGRQASRTFDRRGDAVHFRDHELDLNADTALTRRTFRWWAQRWSEHLTVRSHTAYGYRSKLNLYVLPALGDLKMSEIDRQTCKEFVAGMVRRGYKPSTVRQTIAVLSGVCKTAVDAGAMTANPAQRLGAPSPKKGGSIRPLTKAEVIRLAEAMTDPQSNLIVRFAAWTGLRAGEIWGLRVKDVDLAARKVTVAGTYAERHGRDTTKTNRVRIVGYPAALDDDMKAQCENRGRDEPLYVNARGGPIPHSSFYHHRFQPALTSSGLEGVRFHDLRHTYASLLISRGAHPAEIMHRMGHTTIVQTMDTYGHLFPETERDRADTDWLGEM